MIFVIFHQSETGFFKILKVSFENILETATLSSSKKVEFNSKIINTENENKF